MVVTDEEEGAGKLLGLDPAPPAWEARTHGESAPSHKRSASSVTTETGSPEDSYNGASVLGAGNAAGGRRRSDPTVDDEPEEPTDLALRRLMNSQPMGASSPMRLRKKARSSYDIPADGQGIVEYDDFFTQSEEDCTLRELFREKMGAPGP